MTSPNALLSRPGSARPWWRLLALAVLLQVANGAQASITCSLSPVPTISFPYVANSNNTSAANVVQGSVRATCTRTLAATSATLSLGADNGLYSSGQGNNAQLPGTSFRIGYEFYRDSACGLNFRTPSGNRITATLPPDLNTPVSVDFNYWVCIKTANALTSYPAGTYTDSTNFFVYTGTSNTVLTTGSAPVQVFAPAMCNLGSGPGTIAFSYEAFSPSAAFAGTSFRADCTNLLPYTMSVSPASGVVAGLHYTLGLSLSLPGTASAVGAATLSTQGNATGTATHFINGAMIGGQAGQAGPVVPQVHTLTITY